MPGMDWKRSVAGVVKAYVQSWRGGSKSSNAGWQIILNVGYVVISLTYAWAQEVRADFGDFLSEPIFSFIFNWLSYSSHLPLRKL